MLRHQPQSLNRAKPTIEIFRRAARDENHAVFRIGCHGIQQIKYRDRRNRLLWPPGKWNQGSVIVENQQTAVGMEIGVVNLRGPEPQRLGIGVATAFRNSFLQGDEKAISPMEHIITKNSFVERRHTQVPFLLIKVQGARNRLGRAILIEGVD